MTKAKNNANRKWHVYENIKECSDIGYFIGVIAGDGCARYDRVNRQYRISLKVYDEDFCLYFQKCIYKITGAQRKINSSMKRTAFQKKDTRRYVLRVNSKSLYEIYHKRFNYYSKKYPTEFLKGIFDSEGSVTISNNSPWIRIGMNDSRTILLVKKLLTQLKILCYYHNRKLLAPYHTLSISKLHNKQFQKKVGFRINRKQQRLLGNEKYFPTEVYRTHE